MAGDNDGTNTYEEIRKLRLQENYKRFQDLGISSISKSLTDLTHSAKKSSNAKQRLPNAKPKAENGQVFEPRRSARARNPVTYHDDLDIGLPLQRKYSRSSSPSTSYIARPLDEIKIASYKERAHALQAAEEFQSTLQSGHPSFVKSMVRSHVYSCFWLGLPTQFCKDYLKDKDMDITLVDDNGLEYDAKYLGKRTGLSGGWRAFALDHKLDDGDALVFELVEPHKFKVYTLRVSSLSDGKHDENIIDRKVCAATKNESMEGMKLHACSTQKQKLKRCKSKEDEDDELSNTKKQKLGAQKKGSRTSKCRKEGSNEQSNTKKPQSPTREDDLEDVKKGMVQDGTVQLPQDQDKPEKGVLKCRKKPAPRLLRKRV